MSVGGGGGGTKMEFLGHLVGEGTMSIPEHRVHVLKEFSRPVTKKGLSRS